MLYPCIIKDRKEDLLMKTAIYYRSAQATHTNTPFRSTAGKELVNKCLDLLLTAAIGAGAAAIVLFMSVLA